MISPKSIEELANLVEQDGKKVFLLLRIGVAIVVISTLLCQRLKSQIQSLPLYE